MTTATPSVLLQHAAAGKVRILAQTGPSRNVLISDVPTMSEAGIPGFVAGSWFGILAPAKLPSAIRTTLLNAMIAVQADKGIQTRFAQIGFQPADTKSVDFGAFIAEEIVQWKNVVHKAGIPMQD